MSNAWDAEIESLVNEVKAAEWSVDELVFSRVSLDALSSAASERWLGSSVGALDIEEVIYVLSEKFPKTIGPSEMEASKELMEAISSADYYIDEGFPYEIRDGLYLNCKLVCDGILNLLVATKR